MSPVQPRAAMIAFLGALVIDRGVCAVNASVILDLFAELGISGAATRSLLGRMTREGSLYRQQNGRSVAYRPSPKLEAVIRDGRARVEGNEPFGRDTEEWTLVSFTIPEDQRAQRHQLRARLQWAGFGPLRDGLWLAPGRVDLGRLKEELVGQIGVCEAFLGRPLPGTDVAAFIGRAWDLPALRRAHQEFAARWEDPTSGTQLRPVVALTGMSRDWMRLLGTDPGLPAAHLPPDWPAANSTAIYRRCWERLSAPATAQLHQLLRTAADRR